jgi:hypothetical protein
MLKQPITGTQQDDIIILILPVRELNPIGVLACKVTPANKKQRKPYYEYNITVLCTVPYWISQGMNFKKLDLMTSAIIL